MKIKTVQAPTMQDALRAIKTELGPDAVILSTKRIRQGGRLFGMFGRSMIEVAAATDPGRTGENGDAREGRKPSTDRRFEDLLQVSLKQQSDQGDVPQAKSGRRSPEDRIPERPAPIEWEQVLAELRSIRRLLGDAGHDEGYGGKGLAAMLTSRYQDLLCAGLERATAERIVKEVQEQLGGATAASPAAVRHVLRRLLAENVRVSGPLLNPEERRKTVIFVGPTGVGKTTTIAKLAAHYRLQEQRSVSLITLDTYRLAAVEQLRMYAHLIGLAADVALTKREAAECIRRRSQADLILIDTAGRSPRDAAGMEELKELISLDHPCEVHLVLSATTRERDLKDGVAPYAGIPISRLLFTKLDETTGFGGLFEMSLRTGLPLSYFSTGQRVPEDLEVVRPERVADLLLERDIQESLTVRESRKV